MRDPRFISESNDLRDAKDRVRDLTSHRPPPAPPPLSRRHHCRHRGVHRRPNEFFIELACKVAAASQGIRSTVRSLCAPAFVSEEEQEEEEEKEEEEEEGRPQLASLFPTRARCSRGTVVPDLQWGSFITCRSRGEEKEAALIGIVRRGNARGTRLARKPLGATARPPRN